jgi:hypothetical protein
MGDLALNHLGNFLLKRHGRKQVRYPSVHALLAVMLAARDQSTDEQGDQTLPRTLPPKPRFH